MWDADVGDAVNAVVGDTVDAVVGGMWDAVGKCRLHGMKGEVYLGGARSKRSEWMNEGYMRQFPGAVFCL